MNVYRPVKGRLLGAWRTADLPDSRENSPQLCTQSITRTCTRTSAATHLGVSEATEEAVRQTPARRDGHGRQFHLAAHVPQRINAVDAGGLCGWHRKGTEEFACSKNSKKRVSEQIQSQTDSAQASTLARRLTRRGQPAKGIVPGKCLSIIFVLAAVVFGNDSCGLSDFT